MRELTYTLLELEKGSKKTCDFCSNLYGEDNRSVNQIVTRIKTNGKYISDNVVCEECREKFESDELLKCEKCGRLQTKSDFDFCNRKYVCDCVRYNEDLEEKEISPSPPRESMFAFYERQINALREEKITAEETIEMEREVHEDAMKAMGDWYTKYQNVDKGDLLKRVVELEAEVIQLKEENKKLVPEELAQKIESYEKEIAELREKLERINQRLAQIEVPAKNRSIDSF